MKRFKKHGLIIFVISEIDGMHTIFPYVFALFIGTFSSCTSTKSLTYFQGEGASDTARYATLRNIQPVEFRIHQDDILAIVVSSLSEESNLLFNVSNLSGITTSSFPGLSSNGIQPLGYLVDAAGEVNIPLLGKTKLAGMTLVEAGDYLTKKLSEYLKNPIVNVRQLNSKFTVIGEVGRPGVYNLLNSHTTIPEIIGMVGDLSVYGRRDNVTILRTNQNKREIIKIDLTSRNILNSPNYFVQNNDVIYVEARPGKVASTSRTVQTLPIVLSITSTVLIIFNLLRR